MSHRLLETKDIVATLVTLLQEADAKRVFLVRGRKSYEACGAEAAIQEAIQQLPITLTEYMDFSVNPKDEEARLGLQLLLESQPDVIIAIGGGSVMDMAKLIRHYAAEQKCDVPLWAIPTTAGTGAEATHFAVVYREGKKYSVEADDIMPDVAILYPRFTHDNGAYLTACTGFDALAQAIEAFWNPNATEESKSYSVRAIELLYKQLPQCVAHPEDTSLRGEIQRGAYWAGRAINITKTTAPHAFSYAFTTHYGYPHGHAVALTFPFFMKLNGTKDLYELLGVREDDAMQKMEEYISKLGLSMQLAPEVDVKGMLQEVNIQRLSNNPVKVTPEIITELETYMKSHQKEDLSRYNPEGSTLRKAQLRMVDILVEVDKICRKHKIEYYLDWGSLLGAVRHGGFIPWDDDLDINVRWSDRSRLRKALQEELPDNLCYQDITTDFNFHMTIAKVRDKKSIFDDPSSKRMRERGMYIDIFYNEPAVPMWIKKPIDFVYIRCIRGVHNYSDRFIEKFLGYVCYPPTILAVWICRLWAKIVNLRHLGHQYGWKSTLYVSKDIVYPVREIQFEKHTFFAPNNYDAYLRTLYGDYMQIPPEDKRLTHRASITFLDERENK